MGRFQRLMDILGDLWGCLMGNWRLWMKPMVVLTIIETSLRKADKLCVFGHWDKSEISGSFRLTM